MNQQPVRPATPSLDKARVEAEALAKYEQEKQEYERRNREEAPARAKARAERIAHLKQCYAVCKEARDDAEGAVRELVAALDRYVAATGLPPYQVNPRIQNYLARYLSGYGSLDGRNSNVKDDLLDDLKGKMEVSDA